MARLFLLGVSPGEYSGGEDNDGGSAAESPAAASVGVGAGCAGAAAPMFGAIVSTARRPAAGGANVWPATSPISTIPPTAAATARSV